MPVKTRAKSPAKKSSEPSAEVQLASPAEEMDDEGMPELDGDEMFPDSTDPNAVIKIYRIDDQTKKWSYHGRLGLTEKKLSRVAELFGGGQYRAQLNLPNSRGSLVIRQTMTFTIPGAYRPPMNLPGVGAAPVSGDSSQAVVHGASPVAGMSASETLNTALVSQVIELMKATREQPRENPLLAAILPKAIEVLGNMMMKKNEPDEGIAALLAQQANDLRELRAQLAAKPEAPVKSLKDTIEDVMSIRQLLESGGEKAPDSESMMWAAGLKALEALTGPKAAPTPTAVNPQQAMLADPNTPIWKKVLRGQKQKILMAAGFGLDPYFAADTAIKTMPQGIHGAVIEYLQKPDHVELAMQEIPELREYVNWTTDFFAAASEIMLGEPEEEAQEGVSGADASEG